MVILARCVNLAHSYSLPHGEFSPCSLQTVSNVCCIIYLPSYKDYFVSSRWATDFIFWALRASIINFVVGNANSDVLYTSHLSSIPFPDGNLCFYGKCYYCKGPSTGVCAQGTLMEGAVVLWLRPDVKFEQAHHPWGRTYRKGMLARYVGSVFSSAWLCQQSSWNQNSSVVRRTSYVRGIDYLWSYCMDCFQISVVASPGPYAQTFCHFLKNFFFWFFRIFFRFR